MSEQLQGGSEPVENPLEGLTPKQRLWLEYYLGRANGNASEAARLAGYEDPGQSGWENKKNLEIQAAIQARYAEAAMEADEVLSRLGQQARNEASRFLEVGEGGFTCGVNLEKLREAGLMHLVKGVKRTKYGLDIEFYDAQAALIQIGRHHKLFTDKAEMTGKDGAPLAATVILIPDNGRDSGKG